MIAALQNLAVRVALISPLRRGVRRCFAALEFYEGIGFVVIDAARAPSFLRKRLERHQNRGDGKAYVLMHCEAPQRFCQEVVIG